MRYAGALHRGRVDPRRFGHQLGPVHGPVDAASVVSLLAGSPDPEAVLDALEPDVDHYRWLLVALVRTREAERALRGERPLAVPRRTVEPGDPYADAPRLARRLAALGDLPEPIPLCIPASSPEVEAAREPGEALTALTPALSAGLARFQARHRLPADGKLGRRTAEALNVPLSHRVRQIELALERWRWLPDEFPEPPIVVNIPEFRLLAFTDGGGRLREALAMDVIVGRDDERRRTPVMARRIEQVIFAPYWEVPRPLAEEELLPRMEKEPAFAEKNGFFVEGPGGARPADAAGLALVRAGDARLRQKPGPLNALGRVKFPLDAGDVYLHDTPTRKLFARQARALSHGCVRLADPAGLAAFVLRGRPEWTRERIEAAMAADEPTYVPLDQGPPVYSIYATASAGPDGQPRFAEDVYGLDRKLAQALGRDRARRSGGPGVAAAAVSRATALR
jgi:murein L,D-transpeptidase YcbB/YkuD